jgi:adenylosuccinate synthase
LDIDFGTYPFVTSSNTICANSFIGSGAGFIPIHRVIGVTKAYTTRVGEGPFPTEFKGRLGNYFRDVGNEYGATTRRPRRCGWLDLVILKRAVLLNNVSEIALTKLDILDGLKVIKFCDYYRGNHRQRDLFPIELERAKPTYKTIKGWSSVISDLRNYNKLPSMAKKYISIIEGYLNVKISLISVGQKREAIIQRGV